VDKRSVSESNPHSIDAGKFQNRQLGQEGCINIGFAASKLRRAVSD
jgi:hypothetical protein